MLMGVTLSQDPAPWMMGGTVAGFSRLHSFQAGGCGAGSPTAHVKEDSVPFTIRSRDILPTPPFPHLELTFLHFHICRPSQVLLPSVAPTALDPPHLIVFCRSGLVPIQHNACLDDKIVPPLLPYYRIAWKITAAWTGASFMNSDLILFMLCLEVSSPLGPSLNQNLNGSW